MCMLFVSDDDKGPLLDIAILFPFGLKLSEPQRKEIMRWSVKMGDYVDDYQYPAFQDNNPYA